MFQYMFKPLHDHIDYGFGSLGDSFSDAAQKLSKGMKRSLTSGRLPVCYLYRHAAELYFKSAITILHRLSGMPGPNGKHEAIPYLIVGKDKSPKPLNAVHSIKLLALHYNAMVAALKESIAKITKLDYSIPPEIAKCVEIIEKVDEGSQFFRYPLSKQTNNKDKTKSSMQTTSEKALAKRQATDPSKVFAYLVVDDDGQIVKAYQHDESGTDEVYDALKTLNEYQTGLHAAMRAELAKGE